MRKDMKTGKVAVQVSMPLGLKEEMEENIIAGDRYFGSNSEFIREAIGNQIEATRYLNGLMDVLDNLDVDSSRYDKKYMELATALFSPIGSQIPKMLLQEKQMLLQFHRSLLDHIDKRMDGLERKLMNLKEWSDLDGNKNFSE